MRNITMGLSLCASAAMAEPATLLALGDSLTQGYGLPVEEGFVPQLQAWLAGQGAEVTVLNAGVSGDTTAGGLSRLDWSLTPEVDAMIVNLGGNDLLRGIDPDNSRANLEAILAEAKARGLPVLLVGLRAPGNYGADYKIAFDAIYPDLAERYGAELEADYFQPLIRQDSGLVDTALMQGDGIHPNAAGVARLVEALGPKVLALLDRVPG
ncbi:arylesterase [Paracoccaceae bacterium Fryx2]|nr:arylesterase [Paracoccaceae bacterium Fryx2]